MYSSKFGKTLAVTASYIALAACPSALFAQDAAEENIAEDNVIVVTGTAIRGSAPVGGSVSVVDQSDIRTTGLASVNDVLKTVPQVMSLGAEEGRGGSAQSANSNVTQAKTVNLRGLGTESTLVLLNGRRIVRNGTKASFFDLSVIPTNAIGRIEVMADGASAIYGADAVGGVVNIITRARQDGIEVGGRYGFADGFDEKRFSLSGGLDRDWGNVFVAYEHYERGGLLGNERPQVTMDLREFGGPDLRSNFASPGTIVVGGVTYAVPTGTDGTGLTAGNFIPGTANREDVNDYRSLLFDQNQDNLFGSAEFNLTDNLTAFVEGFYSSRKFEGMGSSLNRGGVTTTLTIPNTNPFFVHPTDPNASSVQMNYSFGDLIPPNQSGGETGYNITGGLSYELPFAWTVDFYGSYGKNHAERYTDQPHVANLPQLLADPDPATAFNPFCDPKAFDCLSPTAAGLLNGYNQFDMYAHQWDLSLKASGSIAELPGGPLAVAVGGEIRRERLRSMMEFLTTTVTQSNRDTTSKRTAKSVFGEVVVPIFGPGNAISGIERLDFSAAVRHDNYGGFGGTTNPKLGFRYDPIRAVSLRGSYGKSFRAPSLADVDIDATRGYVPVTILDPESNSLIRAIQLQGAREGLGPERATTWTLGMDLRPAPGLRASLTFYDVDYQDRLTTISASTILGSPAVFSDFLVRNPSADVVLSYMNSPFFIGAPEPASNIQAIIDAQVSNLGGTKQRGIDGDFSYNFSALDNDWSLGATFNYILDAKESSAKGLPYRDVLDLIDYPVAFKGRARLGWAKDGLEITGFVNHVSGYDNTTVTPVQDVSSWTTLDLTVSYETGDDAGFAKNTMFSLSVVNATDADPPLVINTASGVEGAYDSQKASVIGRFVAFEISKKF